MRTTTSTFLLLVAASASSVVAQPNVIPGTSVVMSRPSSLMMAGRLGTFPQGRNGLAMATTVCNVGTTSITWLAAMNPDHPFYGFLVCREAGGRFEQISDRSFVKHSVSAANSPGCGTCQTSSSTRLGPSCSDTYSVTLNSNRYHLGPAHEIDPWLAAWEPIGSHFDRGEPNVGPPQNMDGQRSLSTAQVSAMDPVIHRVQVDDADLRGQGRYFYSAYVVIKGEPESLRDDNMATQQMVPTWDGTRWQFTNVGTPVSGSPLANWTGATLDSAANGSDDGRIYVAVVVTGPDRRGFWHYQYAVHNRDNSRAAASFRVPLCPSTRVLNATARDIDKSPANDWVVSRSAGELSFLAGPENALEWNTLYNFDFDADAAPADGQVVLDQARPGPGAASLAVNARVPGIVHTEYLGDGCGAPAPSLSPTGSPAFAAIPNPAFFLLLEGLQPGGSSLLLLASAGSSVSLGGGCTYYLGPTPPAASIGPMTAHAVGQAVALLAIPNNSALEGAALWAQAVELSPGGPFLGSFKWTNGLRIRIGNSVNGCQ